MTVDRLHRDLAEMRASLLAETPSSMVTARPPLTSQVQADNSVLVIEEPPAAIGMTLTAPLLRLLDNPAGVRGLLRRWERYCRGKHQRWPDHANGPVCAEIAYAVIRDGTGLLWAAEQAGVDWLRAERLLTLAVERMLAWQKRPLERDESHDREACATCRQEGVA